LAKSNQWKKNHEGGKRRHDADLPMTNLFDTSCVRDEAGHWNEIAERIAGIAARKSKASSAEWLAHSRAGWISACLLLSAALLSIFTQTEKASAARRGAEWAELLAPADEVGKGIVLPDRPPSIGALLLDERRGMR
jgi:hypothetical protein